jgi:glucose/arabinose dehydrogenase
MLADPRLFIAAALAGIAVSFAALGRMPALLTGAAAYGDWREDYPGLRRKITPADMPPPYATASARHAPTVVRRPRDAWPRVPEGFAVELYAEGLDNPRLVRTAPNGDVFVADSKPGRILLLHPTGSAPEITTFAEGLDLPFGIAFWPPGPNPRFLYVANTGAVVRFPYRAGDRQAAGPAETVVPDLPRGGHWTRDIAFSPDGLRLFVSIGSASNAAERWLGGRSEPEEGRAMVLSFTPEGGGRQYFATGLRNCAGMAVEPATGDLWCAVNERDGLGDDLPPDFVTRLRRGAFYGWPWFYIGGNEDPRHQEQMPALRGRVVTPDVLLQPHSAPLGMTFYDGWQFPGSYRGDAFVALHGSWNRTKRTGYKLVRVVLKGGRPTGEYEDFLTGFVVSDRQIWGRPVGVAVASDGSLLVGEDGNGAIWRVSWRGN